MITLIITKSEKVQEAFLNSVKKLRTQGVCVLLVKSYSAIAGLLAKNSVKTSNFLFIDTLSSSELDNVIYVPQEDLTGLSISISAALQSLPEKAALVFDSFSTLSIKHDSKVVAKFARFLSQRLHYWKTEAVIIVAKESTDPELLAVLKQSVDKVEEK
ncbi:Uncharacterised protein [uncultured archaeon]|nr:Uncharacterised protein [uncultured archaeon]